MTNYSKKIIILIGVAIIITAIWLVFSEKINQSIFPEEIQTPPEEIREEVVLVIDYGEGSPQTFEVEFKEGLTAFDLLKNKAEELEILLKTKTYDMGIFIEAIGNKENGQDGKYWMYYVNDELPMVAADQQAIKAGDKVEFKFEKSPF